MDSGRGGRVANIVPEYESVREIAVLRGVPLKDVYEGVTRAARAAVDSAEGAEA